MRELSRASAPAMPHPEALRVSDDEAFLQAVRVVLAKRAPATPGRRKVDHAVRQIISRAVAPEGGVNIFAAAGLRKEHRAGAVLRGDAGADDPPLPTGRSRRRQ